MSRRSAISGIFLGVTLLGGFALWSRFRPTLPRKPVPSEKKASEVERPFSSIQPGDPFRGLRTDDREDRLRTARELHRLLVDSPELLSRTIAHMEDPSTPLSLRQMLAVVLGTLPHREARLALTRLLRDSLPPELQRTVLLALGTRETDDGDLFRRDGQPYAMEAAPGLVVFVVGSIPNDEERSEILRALRDSPSTASRLAAARVLRDSLEFQEVRGTLLDGLTTEPDAEVRSETAAALCSWTRELPIHDAERAGTLAILLDVAARTEEIVRFRLVAPISSTPLTSSEMLRLRALAADPEGDTRRFAVEVLGRRVAEDSETVRLLAGAVLADSSPAVREAAALALGRVAGSVTEALAAALGSDPDWEVRAAAARSLGRAAGSVAARKALETAATADPHPDVRAVAAEILKVR